MEPADSRGKRSRVIVLYFIYFSLLCYLYVSYLSIYWAYTGYLLEYSAGSISLAIAALLAFVLAVPVGGDARSILLNLFLTAYLVPSIVLTALGGQSMGASFIVWVGAAILILVSAVRLPSVMLLRASPASFILIIAFASIFLLLFFYIYGGFRNFNLDITRVYDFREGAEEDLPPLFGYLGATFSKLLIPLGIVAALAYRLRSVAIGFAVISVVLFGFTSHKAMVLYPLIAVVLYYSLEKSADFSKVLLLAVAVMGLCLLDIYFLELYGDQSIWGWFTSIFLRRALFVPPLLDFYYLEFFSRHMPMYWSDSRLTLGLIENPYGITAPYLVGEAYFGNETGANTGFIGSGFGQARIVGTLLYSVGAGLVVALINAHSERQGVAFVTSIMAVPALTMFTSTDFITLFLSHGVLLAFLLLGLIERPSPIGANGARPPSGPP